MKEMRTITLALLLLLTLAAGAQSSRITMLQNSRNLVVKDGQGTTANALIPSGESVMLRCSDGQLIVGRDTLPMATASMRVTTPTRFSVDEDSTTFASQYSVESGLLAFRRSLNVGRWNSLTVPFNLTASQLRDAFGDDCQLLEYYGAVSSPEPALEFATVDLSSDDIVVYAGYHYLLKPTREPDIAPGQQTSVVYGKAKVAGPVYAIPAVTMASGEVMPRNIVMRSADSQVRLRLRGHYATYSIVANNTPRYIVSDEGYFRQIGENTEEKGFRSWVEDANASAHESLRFYIDGIGEDLTDPTGIEAVLSDEPTAGTAAYDMQGRRVDERSLKKGLYIVRGKKIIIK